MADNINVTQGTGTLMATDQIGSVHHPRVKIQIGQDGVAEDVSSTNPLPVVQPGAATEAKQNEINLNLLEIDSKLPELVSGRIPVTIDEVEIKNDAGNPIPVSGTVNANTGLSQPVTDAQLRAVPVPISGTVNTGLSQPVTDAQLRNTPVDIKVKATSSGFLRVQTDVSGGSHVSFPNQLCSSITISNQSGVLIEIANVFELGESDKVFYLPSGGFITIRGILNANFIYVKRADSLNAQVYVTAMWES